jgi:rubredoxin
MHAAFVAAPGALPQATGSARAALAKRPAPPVRAAPRRRGAQMVADGAAAEDGGPEYWPGEIVCTDCGYVYDNAKRKVKFEDLPDSYVCPQCNASKRRFARKVGDFVEKTSGTDNTPIYAFSLAGLAATLAFFFWASKNL